MQPDSGSRKRFPLDFPIAKSIRAFQRRLQDEAVRRWSIPQLEERAEFFVSAFEEHLGKESRILDVGGGWGFYHEPLMKRGHHLTVLDVVKPAYQKAPVVIYPGGRFPFGDKSFDTSILVTMLHHVPDPAEIIREAGRVTRKYLIVVEDTYNHWLGRAWTILRDQIYNFEYFGHPCQFRTRKEWVGLFDSLGFSLVKGEEKSTWLAGMQILNSVMVFEAK